MPYRKTGVVAATPATMMKSPATVPDGTASTVIDWIEPSLLFTLVT